MKKSLFVCCLALIAMIAWSCQDDKKPDMQNNDHSHSTDRLKGDSCVYGLACDGCTDSVLILLPEDEGDPVRYEIIDARRNRRVIGMPKIGDRVAIVVNAEDSLVADMVIDLEQLKATWCYTVMPQMRAFENMSKRLQRRIERNMPDSVRQTLMVPREYGFTLSSNNSARPAGLMMQHNSLDDDSPVVYPEMPMYSEWHIWNGKMILSRHERPSKAKQKAKPKMINDTVDIVMMGPDTLTLRYSDGSLKGYYKKK